MKASDKSRDGALPWHVWGCMLLAFALPTLKRLTPGFIALLALYGISSVILSKKLHFHRSWPLFFLTMLFALHAVGILFSSDYMNAFNELGIKSSFFVFPLIAITIPDFTPLHIRQIARTFSAGCIVFMISAISYGVYRTVKYDDLAFLSYQHLGINYHPTYAATYQALSLFILFTSAAKSDYMFGKRWIHFLAIGLSVLFISMLSSKAGLLAAFISIATGTFIYVRSLHKSKEGWITGVCSMLFLIATATMLPAAALRIEAAIEDAGQTVTTEETDGAHSSTQLRYAAWNSAWLILKENPFGVGTGDTQQELNTKYAFAGEHYAEKRQLNAHNQFLQTGAELGWPGVFMLMAILLAMLAKYNANRDPILLNFALLIAMNFLFESFLEVQAGIVFFCFWMMVFAKTEERKKNHSPVAA